MTPSRVLIHCKLRLYTDIFIKIFKDQGLAEVLAMPSPSACSSGGVFANIILLSLDDCEYSDLKTLSDSRHESKLVAFSPRGDLGLTRLPGESHWQEIRPFGFAQLMREVLVDTYMGPD